MTDLERLARLEDAVVDLANFVVENQLHRFTRSLAAPDSGSRVHAFVEVIEAERKA
ncbi:MAG: hypothetical protein ACLQQM_02820 [Acidimicrobiales bacterium]